MSAGEPGLAGGEGVRPRGESRREARCAAVGRSAERASGAEQPEGPIVCRLRAAAGRGRASGPGAGAPPAGSYWVSRPGVGESASDSGQEGRVSGRQ